MAKFFWDLRHGRSHASNESSLPERLCLMEDALAMQDDFLQRKKDGEEYNFLLFVEHDKTYACTPSDKKKIDAKDPRAKLLRVEPRGLPVHLFTLPENNGGSIMYHGPGQIVCYLILCMEELGIQGPLHLAALIDKSVKELLTKFGIVGYTAEELCKISDSDIIDELISRGIMKINAQSEREILMAAHGIWGITEEKEVKKIASRGLRIVAHRVLDGNVRHFTKFGFAVNISTDLSYFDFIYPCGLDIQMTSIKELTGQEIPLHTAISLLAQITIKNFQEASAS